MGEMADEMIDRMIFGDIDRIDRMFGVGEMQDHDVRARPHPGQKGVGRFRWRDADGKVHDMLDMTTRHLQNALVICARNSNSGKANDIQKVLADRDVKVAQAIPDDYDHFNQPDQRSNESMDRYEAITLLQITRGLRIIGVKFLTDVTGRDHSERVYHYKATPDLALKIGDTVVVTSANGLGLAEVKTIDQTMPVGCVEARRLRHVVGKVDLSRVEAVEVEERKLADEMARAEAQQKLAKFIEDSGLRLGDFDTPVLLGKTAEADDAEVVE